MKRHKKPTGRKQSRTFSIDYHVTMDFDKLCAKRGKSPNHMVERLMRSFVIDFGNKKIEYINCEVCGDEYSNLLKECPTCRAEKEKAILEAKPGAK